LVLFIYNSRKYKLIYDRKQINSSHWSAGMMWKGRDGWIIKQQAEILGVKTIFMV
jgi:hypothetical protein